MWDFVQTTDKVDSKGCPSVKPILARLNTDKLITVLRFKFEPFFSTKTIGHLSLYVIHTIHASSASNKQIYKQFLDDYLIYVPDNKQMYVMNNHCNFDGSL